MKFHVARTRIRAQFGIPATGGTPIGGTRYSHTFATREAAELEARSWADTGDWSCEVVEGRSPAAPRTQARR